jgi:hypothetical protein
MSKLNIISDEPIKLYLETLADNREEVVHLLQIALVRALKKIPQFFDEVKTYPDDAPEWLTHEKFASDRFYVFNPKKIDAQTIQKLHHISDWIAGAFLRNEDWLQNSDEQGRPYRLLSIGSIETAFNMANKDMAKASNKLRTQFLLADNNFELQEEAGNIRTVRIFQNGYRFVRLLTPLEFDRETAFMNHCIGNGNYDSNLNGNLRHYFSLRNEHNIPKATLEVINANKGMVFQCRGRRNMPPDQAHIPMIHEFIREHGWRVSDNMAMTALLERDGVLYDASHLPEGFVAIGTLDFSGAKWLTHLPKGLTIKYRYKPESIGGSLNLRNCKNLVALPEGLNVDADLYLHDCTGLRTLPKRMRVGGDIYWGERKYTSVRDFRAAFEKRYPPTQKPTNIVEKLYEQMVSSLRLGL